MRIRKLTLQGFKSFADRATFQFGDGIAGVVGPNGCGKSNVVDAVKWCIGEQSARSLRGDAMSDVIFAGSAGRSAVSFAEVSLTFAASDEPFPGIWARFAEIDVTRRLYRDGHSEYLLNQERVRLRDLQDLFMDSGVGNQLYSFIEQGRIGQIVHARPEQRRTLIEEAAGISRYKARREETLQKLEGTRTALERVADLSDEMARQLRSAERAVQRAARWRWLQARLRQEEIALGLVRSWGLVADRRALGERARAARAELEESGRAVERHEQELASRRESLERLDEEVGRLRDRLGELEGERRVEESALQYQAREVDGARQRLTRLDEDQEALRLERDTAVAEARERGGAADAGDGRLAALRSEAERVAEVARTEGARVAEARSQLEQARRAATDALSAAVRARTTRSGMGARREDLAARRAGLGGRRAEVETTHLDEEIARASGQLQSAEAEVGAARAAAEQARAGVAAAERLREAAVTGVRAGEQALLEATRARASVQARHDGLLDQERRHVDVPDAVRAAARVPGAIGPLAGQLDVPAELDAVLARALDGALDTVLVPDAATAVAAARAAGGGRARILVVPTAGGAPEGLLAEVVGSAPGLAALRQLAGNVASAPSVADALERWSPGRRFVTADGAVLREDGLLSLGVDAAAGTASLRRRRELAELEQRLAGCEEAVARAQAEVTAARERVSEADAGARAGAGEVEAARTRLRERENMATEARHGLDLRRAEKVARVRAAEALDAEALALSRAEAALDAEEERANAALADAEARQAEAELAVRGAQGALEGAEPALARAQEELQRLRLEAATTQRDATAHREAETAASRRAERAEQRSQQVARERSDLEARVVRLGLESTASQARLQELGEALGAVRVELEQRREEVVALRDRVKLAEAATRSARERAEAARERLGALERDLVEVKGELERLRTDLEDRHRLSIMGLLDRLERDGQVLLEGWEPVPVPGVTPPEPIPTLRLGRADLDGDVEARRAEVLSLREHLGKVGEVNLAAEEEYRDIADRHEDLARQRADLEEAMRIIEEAIGAINRTCRDRFRETFDLVDEHFRSIYPKLVGGGSARLELTDEEDLLTTGVEIAVQPPGKRVQSLSLLSGGEKAMAAIALIFSLFRVKPSPFCLLDEVDATLEEGNGARFNDMLREMSKLTQFIVVTHNKKTMECADVLYGVTMPEPGTSRLVTVRIE